MLLPIAAVPSHRPPPAVLSIRAGCCPALQSWSTLSKQGFAQPSLPSPQGPGNSFVPFFPPSVSIHSPKHRCLFLPIFLPERDSSSCGPAALHTPTHTWGGHSTGPGAPPAPEHCSAPTAHRSDFTAAVSSARAPCRAPGLIWDAVDVFNGLL